MMHTAGRCCQETLSEDFLIIFLSTRVLNLCRDIISIAFLVWKSNPVDGSFFFMNRRNN